MLRLLGLVVSIGLADSMNPSTIAPALYLGSGEQALRQLSQFTLGVFGVYALGGAIIVLGPGEGLLALVPRPSATTRYILELVAGVVMVVGGAVLWHRREALGRRQLPAPRAGGRSSLIVGVTITAVELPTAFPYFAAIAAIVGSGLGLGHQLIALAVYNICFVAPLLAIIATVGFAGDRAEAILQRARDAVQHNWPQLLAGLALIAGVFVATLGITGLAMGGHGSVATFSRRLRKVISH